MNTKISIKIVPIDASYYMKKKKRDGPVSKSSSVRYEMNVGKRCLIEVNEVHIYSGEK